MFKYLICAGKTLYTVRDGALVPLPETTPTAALFTEYGFAIEQPVAGGQPVIPVMNANNYTDDAGTWVASCSTWYGTNSELPYHAFDATTVNWTSKAGDKPCWLRISMPKKAAISGYTVASHLRNSEYPKAWILQGSNDGITWEDLDTQSVGSLLNDKAEHTYQVLTEAYQFYQLYITDCTNYCAVRLFQLISKENAGGIDRETLNTLLHTLVNPAVLKWTDAEELTPMTAVVTGTPYPQTIESLVDMSSSSILGITSLTANYSGDVGVRYSVDEKATWSEEMSVADFLNSDKEALFAAVSGTRRMWFDFILYAGAKLTDFQMRFKN